MQQALFWEHENEYDMISALKKQLNWTGNWPFQEGLLGEVAPKMNLEGKVGVSQWGKE